MFSWTRTLLLGGVLAILAGCTGSTAPKPAEPKDKPGETQNKDMKTPPVPKPPP
jgi:hypothetical protein